MMNAGLGALMPGQSDQSFNFPAKQPMTPGDIVKSLSNLSVPELVQIGKSQPTGVPLWAVITAISEAQKKAQINAANQRQTAMQQGAQLAQSPTVAQEVLNSANYTDDTVYAANGGEMRVQSFQSGGNPQVDRILKKSPQSRTSEENKILEDAGIKLERRTLPTDSGISRFDRWLASPFIREAITGGALSLSDEDLAKRTDTAATNEKIARVLGAKPAPAKTVSEPVNPEDLDPTLRAVRDIRPLPSPEAPPARDVASDTAGMSSGAPPSATGIAAFSPQSELAKRLQEIREGTEAERGALRGQKDVPQSVLDARKRIDEILALTGTQYETERGRMAKSAEEAKRRAQERAALNPFADPATLGRMVAASSGKKTLGETLAAMAGAAGESQQERDKALRDAEDRYDLRQSELFKMDQLRTQINLESAKLVEARADGDFKRAKDIEEKLQKLKREAAIQQSNILIQMMDAQVKGEATQAQRESTKFARESQALQTAQLRVAQAEEAVIKTLQKEFGPQLSLLNMNESEFANANPDVYAKIKRREADLRKTVIDPAVKERDRLQLIATGLPSGVTVTEKK